ncbi:MAG: transcriptional repressor [Candidatus Aminicenantes bacterium]|nr:transcriptional repressor [Candidatus Aminicenantes bacterium]
MDSFREICHKNNLKVTPQRLAIYEALLKSKDHPGAEILHERVKKAIPDISLDTVNRTLLTFARIGVSHIVEGYGEVRRFDPRTENHHHFRCLNCSTIIDFQYKPYDDIIIPGHIQKKLTVLKKKVLLEGYCDRCRGRK